ncbi:hypothetical protein AL062_15650 [Pseudomonas syringae pv. syringae]|nr:hypothetical protein AL062_15650 [Pseudomonas syringae pv. syringae]
MHAHRYFALEGHPAYDALLGSLIIQRVMLGGAVIPDRYVTAMPAPAHNIFRPWDVTLQQAEQVGGGNVVRLRL